MFFILESLTMELSPSKVSPILDQVSVGSFPERGNSCIGVCVTVEIIEQVAADFKIAYIPILKDGRLHIVGETTFEEHVEAFAMIGR